MLKSNRAEGYRKRWGPPAGGILSSREDQVLRLASERMANQEIAEFLGISVHTVKNHMSNIFVKLGVKRRIEAVTMVSPDRSSLGTGHSWQM